MRLNIAIVAAGLLLAGCSSSSTSGGSVPNTSGAVDTKAFPRIGTYAVKVDTGKPKDDPAAKMAEGFAEMLSMDLEIAPDNHFIMSAMGAPIEGAIVVSGDSITLTPDHIMGKTLDEYKKLMEEEKRPVASDPAKVMKGSISKDGTVITLNDPDKPGAKLVCTLVPPKPVGPSTVTTEEAKYTGAWAATLDPTKAKPDEVKRMGPMVPFFKAVFQVDNTFEIKVGLKMEGSWKVIDGKISCVPTDKSFNNGKPVELKIDGDKLIPLDGANETPFYFTKK